MMTLPPGYYARPVCLDDLQAAVDLFNAYSRTQVGKDDSTVESTKVGWQSPYFHLDTDTMAIFTSQGQMVGYDEFWDWGEPHVRLIGWAAVHPEHWGRGLGSCLVEWSINRARQNIALAPEGARAVLHHYDLSDNLAAADLLARYGFRTIRISYHMRIDFDQPPQPPVLPAGITIRSIANEEEQRAAEYAAYEAFQDHWGHVNQPFEEYYERTKYYLENDPKYDPSLRFIALDGETVAGASLCYPYLDDDPDQGWVGTLGVRRPWRKRGIALALLQHSFCEFYRRGQHSAGLSVDADSLTGAVRLYERAGMHVVRKSNLYELELRPGKNLMTQEIK